MAYRNGNYSAFYVDEPFSETNLGAHATRDFVYYNLLRAWKGNDSSFPFVDSHDKNYNVRDGSDWERTLKPRIRERLRNSKNVILFLSSVTKNSRALARRGRLRHQQHGVTGHSRLSRLQQGIRHYRLRVEDDQKANQGPMGHAAKVQRLEDGRPDDSRAEQAVFDKGVPLKTTTSRCRPRASRATPSIRASCYGMTSCQHSCVRQHLWPLSAGLRRLSAREWAAETTNDRRSLRRQVTLLFR